MDIKPYIQGLLDQLVALRGLLSCSTDFWHSESRKILKTSLDQGLNALQNRVTCENTVKCEKKSARLGFENISGEN